jgi:hypothetical protein
MFVASPLTYMSPCSSASIHHAQPLLFTPNARPLKLIPYFVFSKQRPDSGLLLPTSTWDYQDTLLITPHEWAERRDENVDKLFWRGLVTGWVWHKGMASRESGITWRDGARAKLALSFGPSVAPGDEVDVLMENNDAKGGLVTRKYEQAWLNEKWMDIGLSGSPLQCNKEQGICDEMQNASMWGESYSVHKHSRKKFVVDIGMLTLCSAYRSFI